MQNRILVFSASVCSPLQQVVVTGTKSLLALRIRLADSFALFPSLAFFICMQPVSHSRTHAAADGLKALDITAQPLWPCCPFFVVVRLCTWMAQLTGSCSPTRNGHVCARGFHSMVPDKPPSMITCVAHERSKKQFSSSHEWSHEQRGKILIQTVRW
jgi:hypothetical protein